MDDKTGNAQNPEPDQPEPSGEKNQGTAPAEKAPPQSPATMPDTTAPHQRAGAPPDPSAKTPTKTSALHKYTLYTLVGGLVVSALISIIAILIGEFTETIQRAITTTVLMMVHALMALAFISVHPPKDKVAATIIMNITFALIVASFFTSVLGVWQILSGGIVGSLYTTYILALVLTLIVSLLLTASRDDAKTQALANTSIGSGVFLYALMQPWIFTEYADDLPDLYFRSVAAMAVLFATLAVLTTIFHRLYTAKHRAEKAAERERLIAQGATPPTEEKRRRLPTWAIVLIVLGIVLFLAPIAFWAVLILIFALTW